MMREGIMNNELGIRILKIIFLYSLFFIPYSISAQSVDLLWQGETYTPPFYKGRALWSTQSKINLVAIPQGLGNSTNLNYKWTKNGTVLGSISGMGKNSLSLTDSILSKPQLIKVEILSSQNTVLARDIITITPVSPGLAVYENNPLYGFMFHRETGGSYQLQEREVTLGAFPFFFSTLSRTDNTISYEWRTNVGAGKSGNLITYRTPDDATGSSNIRIRASSQSKITQDINKNILITFENDTRI